MKTFLLACATALGASRAATNLVSAQQVPMSASPHIEFEKGVGHFSDWSRDTKKQFLIDWQDSKEEEWILVLGNEGGDLDSIASAMTWSYHLMHATANTSNPLKAITLLQTPTDALDLRPENKLALHNSQMSSGHRDLLNINELPEDPETLSAKVKGIVLVDHAEPLRKWRAAKTLSIFDHHVDSGYAPDAKPRIFEKTASCSTLVARQMLDELEKLDDEYHVPHELWEMVLSAIAVDSNGLDPEKATDEDRKIAERVLARSDWRDKSLDKVMDELDETIGDARKDLDHLSLRDLLRRDWKSNLVDTPSPLTPTVSLGFASIPYSMDQQIARSEYDEIWSYFSTQAAFSAEVSADVFLSLNKYKVKIHHNEAGVLKKKKIREIVLRVRDDVRVNEEQADELFKVVVKAIEEDENLRQNGLQPWHRASELGKRQMVWRHEYDDGE